MRKFLLSAGILLVAALAFANPSKADTVVFTLTGGAMPGGASFSLPDTFTPTSGTSSGPFISNNAGPGTLLGSPFTFPFVEVGLSATGQWAFGSNGVPNFSGTTNCLAPGSCPYLGIFAPGLFTANGDGTITLNEGLGTLIVMNNAGAPLTLAETVIASPVGTPEPASLLLLGFGGLSLLGLRRRKAA